MKELVKLPYFIIAVEISESYLLYFHAIVACLLVQWILIS